MAPTPEMVILKEQAVFRLDGRGRWHNAHGRIEHPKISTHFHRAIRKDAGGYHLYQDHGSHREKVYFPYEDTALFVWDLEIDRQIVLTLNTGRRITMDLGRLFCRGDALYYLEDGDRIKFTPRTLVKLAPFLEEVGPDLVLIFRGRSHAICMGEDLCGSEPMD